MQVVQDFGRSAVAYALNIEDELKKFLEDSRLNIDNNPAERLNRGVAMIRKNCLFAGSETGGRRLAILYFFATTCKANNICFRKWIEDILPRLSATPASQIESLLPPNWKSAPRIILQVLPALSKILMPTCSSLGVYVAPQHFEIKTSGDDQATPGRH